MKKLFTLSAVFFLLFTTAVYSQSKSNTNEKKEKNHLREWTTDPFDHHIFIANKGQFDGKIPGYGEILYGAQLGDNMWAYFTPNGVTYGYAEFPETAEYGADPDEDGPPTPAMHYLNATWQGANSYNGITPSGELSYYYTYPKGANQTIKTFVYKKITYKNIYPGIDIEYSFIPGKDGLKYAVIVHPGANIASVKLNYDSAGTLSADANGNVNFNCKLGRFTDHTPVSYYENAPQQTVAVSYNINAGTETFTIGANYDRTKTFVIDPWTTNPAFTGSDKAYDLQWDFNGNVYAYGSTGPFQLVKMNSAGIIQWTFNASTISGDYGAICTDKFTGTSYLVQGFGGGQALKVNTFGSLLATFPGNSNVNEMWRVIYDHCNGHLVVGAGSTNGPYQAGVLDTNMVNFTPVNALGATQVTHDVELMAIDPNGVQAYMATARSLGGDPNHFGNYLMQMPLPNLLPTSWMLDDHFAFIEVTSIHYTGTTTNGMNGAAASPSWLYIYDGDTVKQLVKNTGAVNAVYSVRLNTPFVYGGLDVDPCDNLFVGVQDSIYVLDANTFTLLNKIPLQNTVYDVRLGKNGVLYACGVGFVSQVINPNPSTLIANVSGNPTSCSACDGTASPTVNCGVPPYSFLWSDGQTTQTATGLCAGIYTLTVSDGACPPTQDTIVVNISGKAGYSATISDTNPDPSCGRPTGNSIVSATGGTPPYTYLWSDGQTNAMATGLTAGIYTCKITDNAGCNYIVATTLFNLPPPAVFVNYPIDSICNGGSLLYQVSGLSTYNWLPTTALSCTSCSNPTANPTSTVTYTISGVDADGCSASATAFLKVSNTAKPTITGRDSICHGFQDTLVVTGGNTYVWHPSGSTADSIFVSPASTRTYTVAATNGACAAHDTTFTLSVISPPAPVISPPNDSSCIGDSSLITASGGAKYLWSTGQTSSAIWVHPNTPTSYSVTAFAGTCSGNTNTIVQIKPITLASLSVHNDTICASSGSANLLVNVTQGGPVTYKWSNNATTPGITVNPGSTATYTATVYGQCDSVVLTKTVHVLSAPTINLNPFDTICQGSNITLIAHGGGTYKWSNGATTSSIQVNPNSNTTYTVAVDSGCIDSATAAVAIDIPSIHVCCDDSIKAGATVQLTATGANAYAWTPTSSLSCSTCPNPFASPTLTTTYTVTGTDADGCAAAADVIVSVIEHCADFVVPNTFTPNNDGINDDLVVNVLNATSYNITIYDRWGKQVYTSSNASEYWNGRINGTENLVPDGVYYYVIAASCASNNYNKKGFVEVVGEK